MFKGCSKIRCVLAKPRLILDKMCCLYGKFASHLRRILCKTRLIFPRINGPNVTLYGGQANELGWDPLKFNSTKIPLHSLAI